MKAIMIGAGNRGMEIYAPYAKKYPNELEFVGVAEVDAFKRDKFTKEYLKNNQHSYATWEEILEKDRLAECAFICTQDNMHYEPTMLALEKGYHVLLEKPISGNKKELINLYEQAKKYDRQLSIAHVLRYAEIFNTLKEIINSKKIGEVTSIQHAENIGYWHYSHSFVRGHWRNSEVSNPIILAKACHDMDLLSWLADSDCKQISSFGSLKYFNAQINQWELQDVA